MRRAERLLVVLWLVAASASAEPAPQDKLDAVQRNLEQSRKDSDALRRSADALQAEVTRLQAQEVAVAKNVQDNEAQLTVLERSVQRLADQEATERTEFEAHRAHGIAALSALERLAMTPPVAIVFSPETPVDAARGGMLLGAVVPKLQAEVRDAQAALDELHKTQRDITAKRQQLSDQQAVLDKAQLRVADLIKQKQTAEGQTAQKAEAAQQRVATLVAAAADLRDAISRLDRERAERDEAARDQATRQAAVRPPAAVSSGVGLPRLMAPVAGGIVKHFGDPDGASNSRGLTFAVRAGGQVIAPASGEVLFAGPFQGYGQILIIDNGGGYHSLLAGIGRIQAAVGQHVVGGEPVGTMPADGTPTLYLELRRQGQPVDPLPGLAVRDVKASG